MNRNELLDNWLEHGLITLNVTKEIYAWTRKAKKLIPLPVRVMLSSISKGTKIKYQYQIVKLKVYGFDEKGFYNGNAK